MERSEREPTDPDHAAAPGGVPAVLRALAAGDRAGAVDLARADRDASPLAGALHRYLARAGHGEPYTEPAAFREFIDHGDNPPLYAAVDEALRALHREVEPEAVLDVGCGDGRVTAAALGAGTRSVDLVDPSESLLREAVGAVRASVPDVEVHEHRTGASAFLAAEPSGRRWDLAQSTFALHTMPRAERREVLAGLQARASVVAVVEFDAPPGDLPDAERFRHLAERYERAVGIYAGHDRAVDGFLMPVLVGQVLPDAPRHTFEEPIDAWRTDLGQAGFEVTSAPLFDHWWATAHLVVGRRPGS